VSLPAADAFAAVTPIIEALEQLQVSYHIGGSFAIAAYGVPRASVDVDLVAELRLEHVEWFVARLQGRYYVNGERVREAILEQSSFNLVDMETAMKVDVFIPERTPFADQEQARARSELFEVALGPRFFFVKSPEDLVLRKLRWYRDGGEVSERQWSDVVGLLRAQAVMLDDEYLRRWATELGVTDLLQRSMAVARGN